MRAELGTLHRQLGATMIYVTHDQVEAMTLATRIAVLEGGVLQQVAPPLELFHRPANRFVASFIGSPAMNLLDGRLVPLDGVPTFTAPGLALPLPGADGSGDVGLGVRPHDIRAGAGAASMRGAVRGTIEALEPMGWETWAHVRIEAGKIVVRLEGANAAAARIGDTLAVAFDPATVHLFDASGRAIRSPAIDALAAGARTH